MENEIETGGKQRNWDYAVKTENYMKEAQKLNNQIRTVCMYSLYNIEYNITIYFI